MTEDGVIYCGNCNANMGLVTYGKKYTITCLRCLESIILDECCSFYNDNGLEGCQDRDNCKSKCNNN